MILTTDAAYCDDTATAVGILHPEWQSDDIARIIIKKLSSVAPYEPGRFYKRELPCILSVLEETDGDLEAIVIDGFVDLGREARPGLGRHLFEATGESPAVIGVAKAAFRDTPDECRVFRGNSKRPLYVTAAGLPLARAKSHILAMHGASRIPTLLKRADLLCRANGP